MDPMSHICDCVSPAFQSTDPHEPRCVLQRSGAEWPSHFSVFSNCSWYTHSSLAAKYKKCFWIVFSGSRRTLIRLPPAALPTLTNLFRSHGKRDDQSWIQLCIRVYLKCNNVSSACRLLVPRREERQSSLANMRWCQTTRDGPASWSEWLTWGKAYC